MSEYKIQVDEKEYILNKETFSEFLNDEEKPVKNINLDKILELLNQSDKVNFDVEYYQGACPKCLKGVKEKQKFFEFLEYQFFIYTKDCEYVISDISKEYEGLSFNKLLRANKVDDSYVVSTVICSNCGDYVVQIENCIV